jgi:RNA polymerase sigma-70 factor (ECF subfamily)
MTELMAAPSTARSRKEYEEFERHVESTRRRAYNMAIQLTRSPREAEDLVQETFVKAWKGYESYSPGRPFLNWLLRIMQRAYLDAKRRDNPIRKAESLNAMISPSDGEVQEFPVADLRPGPDEELTRQEFVSELTAALDELPHLYREAIVLCDIENLSYFEIAEHQRTTVGTVRSRIHRGRRILREIVLRKSPHLMS